MKRKGLRRQLALWIDRNSHSAYEYMKHYKELADNNRDSMLAFGIRKTTEIEEEDIAVAMHLIRMIRVRETHKPSGYSDRPLEDRLEELIDELHKKGWTG